LAESSIAPTTKNHVYPKQYHCDEDNNVQFKISNPKPVVTQSLDYVTVEDDVVLFQDDGQYAQAKSRQLQLLGMQQGIFIVSKANKNQIIPYLHKYNNQ
jgi:hypothetical protein